MSEDKLAIRLLFLVGLVCSGLSTAGANEQWSFDAHPLPDVETLTLEQRSIMREADEFLRGSPVEKVLDRFKPLYAHLYPDAPPVPDGSLLENHFLRHLLEHQPRSVRVGLLGATSRAQLWRHAAPFHAATGRMVCSLEMSDLKDWPMLESALETTRAALLGRDPAFQLYGVQLANRSPAVEFVNEILLFAHIRSSIAQWGSSSASDIDAKEWNLTQTEAAAVHEAALRGDVDVLLRKVGDCEDRD